MFEIGSTLRETRVRRKTTLQQAEDDTKIRVKYIQAMENDDFDLMPSPAYVKGFLRTYSLYLGLDADVMLDEYRSRFEPNEEHEPFGGNSALGRPHAHRRRNTLTFIAVVCLLILAVLYVIGRGNSPNKPPTPAAGHRHQPHAAAEPDDPPHRHADRPVRGARRRRPRRVLDPGPQERHRRPDPLPDDDVPGPVQDLQDAQRIYLRLGVPAYVSITVDGKSSYRPAETVSTNYEVTRKGVVKL